MSRGIWLYMSARTRRSLTLLWAALFVFSFVLQYASFAAPATTLGASLTVNLDQYANGGKTSAAGWQNGDLNGNNSTYAEGKVVPFRLAIEGLTAGTHTIHINYDFTAGGHEAYDFLASYDATESPDVCASGGGGVSSLCPVGTPSAVDFPTDPFAIEGKTVSGAVTYSGVEHKLRLWGGTIDDISVPVHSGSVTGNSTGDMTVTFTTSGSAAFCAWGGHLAQSAYWLPSGANGAGQISGAPWHMRTQQLDDSANKNQDRSIQPSALVEPPDLAITKTADAASVSAGSPIGFTITVTNGGAGAATGVHVSDTLPTDAGTSWSIDGSPSGDTTGLTCGITGGVLTCDKASLTAGQSFSLHIVSPTTAATIADSPVDNTATVTTTNDGSGEAHDSVRIPDLTIAKTFTGNSLPPIGGFEQAAPGDTLTYTLAYSLTNGPVTDGVITDVLPAGQTYVDGSATDNADFTFESYDSTTRTLTWTAPTVTAGGSVTYQVTIDADAADIGTLTNPASIVSADTDQVTVEATVLVPAPPEALTGTAPAPPGPAEVVKVSPLTTA